MLVHGHQVVLVHWDQLAGLRGVRRGGGVRRLEVLRWNGGRGERNQPIPSLDTTYDRSRPCEYMDVSKVADAVLGERSELGYFIYPLNTIEACVIFTLEMTGSGVAQLLKKSAWLLLLIGDNAPQSLHAH